MSGLGQPGPNGHSSNAHAVPGLQFPHSVRGRGFTASHSATPPKPSPTPQQPQHQSPYGQPQHYTPQQPAQSSYPAPLFSTTPSPVPGVHSVPNGNARHAPNQAHAAAAAAASRQRTASQRHIPQQSQNQLAFMQQHMSQQVQQQQQKQSVGQAQPIQQTHQVSQQVQPVQSQQQPVQQISQPQQVHPPSDPNLMNQAPQTQTRHQAHAQPHQAHQAHQAPSQQNHAQGHQQQSHQQTHAQSHQAPQPLPPQVHQPHAPLQATASQALPSSASAQADPTPQSDDHHSGEMDVDSQDEGIDGDDRLSPKLIEGTPYVPRTPQGPMMSPPPEGGSYASLEAVHKEVLSYCTSVGYAVVIGRSKKTVPGLKKVLFVCDRAGKPPSRVVPEQRKRKTTSRKCNCPFGFFAIEQRTQWTIRYRPDSVHLSHNHGPSESPLLHPAARKLDSKMVASVKQLKEAGMCL